MIQFNLLPDVKKEYVKAKRAKRMILSVATLASAGVVGVTILMFTFVHVAQKRHISDLTDDIQTITTEIKSTENLNDILTVQNQLSILPGLHEAKPETSRVFDYLSFVSPATIRITSADLDTRDSSLKVKGSADSIATINKLVDNFKAVTYAVVGSDAETRVYSDVVTELSGNNEGANFEISMLYDPVIFSNTEQVIMRIGTQSSAPEQEEGQ